MADASSSTTSNNPCKNSQNADTPNVVTYAPHVYLSPHGQVMSYSCPFHVDLGSTRIPATSLPWSLSHPCHVLPVSFQCPSRVPPASLGRPSHLSPLSTVSSAPRLLYSSRGQTDPAHEHSYFMSTHEQLMRTPCPSEKGHHHR